MTTMCTTTWGTVIAMRASRGRSWVTATSFHILGGSAQGDNAAEQVLLELINCSLSTVIVSGGTSLIDDV